MTLMLPHRLSALAITVSIIRSAPAKISHPGSSGWSPHRRFKSVDALQAPWMRGRTDGTLTVAFVHDGPCLSPADEEGAYPSSAGEEQVGEEAWHSLADAWLRR